MALPPVSSPIILDMDDFSILDQVTVNLGRQLKLGNGSLFEDVLPVGSACVSISMAVCYKDRETLYP